MKGTKSDIEILGAADRDSPASLPLLSLLVPATCTGFPSPAEEYIESTLDINAYLISNPPATILARVGGESLIDDGIFPGDIAVIDRSREAVHMDRIVAVLNGEMTLKVFSRHPLQLQPRNKLLQPVNIEPHDEFTIFGVLTGLIRKYR